MNEALEVVYKTGEHLHLPELLRQRAEYTLARGDRPASEAVADLEEAILVASEQGAHVARLRAAVALARLPQDLRPADWRDILSTARSVVPAALVSDDTAAADDLLGMTRPPCRHPRRRHGRADPPRRARGTGLSPRGESEP